jgi:hypothetical protein
MQPNIKKDSSRRLLKKRTIPIGPSFMKDSPQKINFKANEEFLLKRWESLKALNGNTS